MSARLVALVLGLVCAAPAGAQVTAAADPPGFAAKGAGLTARGELFVTEGPARTAIALPTKPGAELAVAWSARAEGQWLAGTVTVTNRRAEQAKLEVGLRAQAALKPTEFFDGVRPNAADKEQHTVSLPEHFPLTSLSDGQACLALGYAPDSWLSYFHHSYLPGTDGATLETAARIVVDPGKPETVRFLIGAFPTHWGYREALHWYYEAFPAFFSPRPDVDPRASLNGGSYLAWDANPDAELCRRLQVGWEWCYAPFRRTGDIVGRPEFWDYTPARPHDPPRRVSLEEYHRRRQAMFEAGNQCNVAMMFYIPSQVWCEAQLAREHYPDSLTTDPQVKTYFDTPWCTGPDNELRVFPFMTSFGRQSLVDMAAVTQENNLRGFAFDTANGGARYLGPHVNECPGRAWDESGAYVEEGVAIAKLMDWCHEHKNRLGQTLAVVSNPTGGSVYLTPFRSDSAMIEADPTSVPTGSAQVLRQMLGHKTMVFWHTYELEELLDYEHLTTDQMADALNGLADYTIIQSLKMAAIPTPLICRGNQKLAHWLPLLTEIARAGWQPVPGATCDQGLPLSRAGHGWRQFLMTGNETPKTVTGTVAAENAWLGGGAMLFAREGGGETPNEVAGNVTRVGFSLASRGALVLRSALRFDPAPESLKATVTVQPGLDRGVIRVRLQSSRRGSCQLGLPDWGPMAPEKATLAAKEVGLARAPEGWRSEGPVTLAGDQELVIVLRSNTFGISEDQLFGFPWVAKEGGGGGKPAAGFTIEVAAQAAPEVTYAASRLAAYFPYYYAHAVKPPATLEPAKLQAAGATGPAVALRVDPSLASSCRITLSGARLAVTGKTPADVEAAVFELLAALDRKYEYGGGLVGTEAIRKTGLVGKEVRSSGGE